MVEHLPHTPLDQRAIDEWSRLVVGTANDKGHDVTLVLPLLPFNVTYTEIMHTLRTAPESPSAREYYERIVPQTVGFAFR